MWISNCCLRKQKLLPVKKLLQGCRVRTFQKLKVDTSLVHNQKISQYKIFFESNFTLPGLVIILCVLMCSRIFNQQYYFVCFCHLIDWQANMFFFFVLMSFSRTKRRLFKQQYFLVLIFIIQYNENKFFQEVSSVLCFCHSVQWQQVLFCVFGIY